MTITPMAAGSVASPDRPLGASPALGTTVISPKLIAPLGAQSLTVLQPFPNAHWVAEGETAQTVPLQARSQQIGRASCRGRV